MAASAGLGRAAAQAWALLGAQPSAGREEAAVTAHSGPPGSGTRSPASREPNRGGAASVCLAGVVWGADRPVCGRRRTGRAWAPAGLRWVGLPRTREVAGSPPPPLTHTGVCSWPWQMTFCVFLASLLRPFLVQFLEEPGCG